MTKVVIENFNEKDINQVRKIIVDTFLEFNSLGSPKKGVDNYTNFFLNSSNSDLLKNFSKTPIFLVAKSNKKIIGLVRGTNTKLINLYLDKKFHGKGIGKSLLLSFEKEAKKQNSKFVKVRASLYAVNFYQSQGYKKTTGVRSFKNLNIWPMKKVL
jgi:ribosomal protein S18 acetylase RimI-like enzyme